MPLNQKLTVHDVGLRKDRFERMYSLCLEGKSYSEIGREFGITKERVRQVLNKYSTEDQFKLIRESVERRSLSSWFCAEILAQLEAGHTCVQISKNLGCHVSVVKRVSAKRRRKLDENE
jgi:DNA-binding CsgD family transcriptional regulator